MDHNQYDDPLPFKTIHINIADFVVAQALPDFKNGTILVVLNGKGSSNWLWSTWVQSGYPSFFNRSIQ